MNCTKKEVVNIIKNNEIWRWNYSPTKEKEDAYENIIIELQNISNKYLEKNQNEKEEIIEKLVEKIRKINIFPIIYFSEEGI